MQRSYRFFQQLTPQSTIRLISMDYDGCLGIQYVAPCAVSAFHAPLFDHWRAEREAVQFECEYLMTCSNRQVINIDCANAIYNQNNIMLPTVEMIANEQGMFFDRLLLGDITAWKKPGFTCSVMKSLLTNTGKDIYRKTLSIDEIHSLVSNQHFDYCFSSDKVNIIYAQAHRMSLLHPGSLIQFDVYDDLEKEVLKPLLDFYQQYHCLLPHNIRMSLYHYDTISGNERNQSELPVLTGTVTGSGLSNTDYYQTVNKMSDIAKSVEGIESTYKLSDYLKPEMLSISDFRVNSVYGHR